MWCVQLLSRCDSKTRVTAGTVKVSVQMRALSHECDMPYDSAMLVEHMLDRASMSCHTRMQQEQ